MKLLLPMNSIEVVCNGGKDCGNGGHSKLVWGMFRYAFWGSILGAYEVFHRQNYKILINVLNVKSSGDHMQCLALALCGLEFITEDWSIEITDKQNCSHRHMHDDSLMSPKLKC